MKLIGMLSISLLAGLWQSLEFTQCQNFPTNRSISQCYNKSSGKICFTTFLANNSRPVRKPFEKGSRWCKGSVPGSSLIIIDGLDSQTTVERFIAGQTLANETIIMDARKLSSTDSPKWSWVNGHPIVPNDVEKERSCDGACVISERRKALAYCVDRIKSKHHYICEHSDSNSSFSHRPKNTSYVVSEKSATWHDARKECLRLGGDLASITDLKTIGNWSLLKKRKTWRYWIGLHRNKWIWNSTGAAITYADWEGSFPDEYDDKQCICLKALRKRTIFNRKWQTCNCNHNYAIVCQKEEQFVVLTTNIVLTEVTMPSPSGDFKASASFSVYTSTKSNVSMTSSASSLSSSSSAASSSSSPPPSPLSSPLSSSSSASFSSSSSSSTTAIATSSTETPKQLKTADSSSSKFVIRTNVATSTSPSATTPTQTSTTTTFASLSTGLFESFSTNEILLILILLTTVVFIVVAVILIIRKQKHDRCIEGSAMTNATQSEAVYSICTTVIPVNRPSEGIPTVPPGNIIYDDVEMTQRPTSINNTIYANVEPKGEAVDMSKSVVYADLELTTKVQQKPTGAVQNACFSPIYSQPYEPSIIASNTKYAEPFKHRPTAPILDHHAANDQQNIYSLAKAIPLGGPNVIYSEPTKSSAPTATNEAVETTDLIYLNAIEVRQIDENGVECAHAPSAIYAKAAKLK